MLKDVMRYEAVCVAVVENCISVDEQVTEED